MLTPAPVVQPIAQVAPSAPVQLTPTPYNAVVASAVAPSFSIAAVGDNASGNRSAASPSAPSQAPANTSPPSFVPAPLGTSLFASIPTTGFLTQIIGQGLSADFQGILVEYEKLVNISLVKYQPSFASFPKPQPTDVFSQVMQQERAQAAQIQQTQTLQVESREIAQQVTLPNAPSIPAPPAPRNVRSGAVSSVSGEISAEPETIPDAGAAPLPNEFPAIVNGAYQASLSRVKLEAIRATQSVAA